MLLCTGASDISHELTRRGHCRYSHAAFWDGSHVIHATGFQIDEPQYEGIVSCELDWLYTQEKVVDAYRFHADGAELGSAGLPAEPVVQAARSFLAGGYGYHELILFFAILYTTPPPDVFERLGPELAQVARLAIRRAWYGLGGELVPRMEDILRRYVTDRKAMVCTELVATSYWNADPVRRRYKLHVDHYKSLPRGDAAGDGGLPASGEPAPADVRLAIDAYFDRLASDADVPGDLLSAGRERALQEANRLPPLQAGERPPGVHWVDVAGEGAPLYMLTTADLQFSPNLRIVGSLKNSD
ncbi:MAG: hypothetical protein AB7O67_23070 [Vicinamibacterales bacterium]